MFSVKFAQLTLKALKISHSPLYPSESVSMSSFQLTFPPFRSFQTKSIIFQFSQLSVVASVAHLGSCHICALSTKPDRSVIVIIVSILILTIITILILISPSSSSFCFFNPTRSIAYFFLSVPGLSWSQWKATILEAFRKCASSDCIVKCSWSSDLCFPHHGPPLVTLVAGKPHSSWKYRAAVFAEHWMQQMVIRVEQK